MGGGLSVVKFQLAAKRQNNVRLRCSMMCITSFLVDAACMPLHWIYRCVIFNDSQCAGVTYCCVHPYYSQNQIADLIELESQANSNSSLTTVIDFYPVPSCPLYSYPSGALSPYGDELLPVLESLINQNGVYPIMLLTVDIVCNRYQSHLRDIHIHSLVIHSFIYLLFIHALSLLCI